MEDSDDDSELENDLEYVPFSQSSRSSEAVSQSQSSEPVTPTQGSEETGLLERRARRKVQALSDASFDAKRPSDLYWIVLKKIPHPCEARPKEEARFLAVGALDSPHKTLIRYLQSPNLGPKDYAAVETKRLTAFHGKDRTIAEGWCPDLMQAYVKHLKRTIKKEMDIQVEQLFLERVLEEARRKEEEMEARRNRPEEEEESEEEEEEGYVAPPVPARAALPVQSTNSTAQKNTHGAPDKNEPLRAGDVIEYTNPMFVFGDSRGHRRATILSVNPARYPILVVDNGEFLPNELMIKRVQRYLRGKLVPHRGCNRAINEHRLRKSGSDQRIAAGMAKETARIGEILDRKERELAAGAGEAGFAPRDIFHKFKSQSSSSREDSVKSGAKRPRSQDDDESSDCPENASCLQGTTTDEEPVGLAANATSVPVENSSGRKRRRQDFHMTEAQLKLAAKWKQKIVTRFGSTDKEFERGVQVVAEKVGVQPWNLLAKFLSGDPLRLVASRVHGETEETLVQANDSLCSLLDGTS